MRNRLPLALALAAALWAAIFISVRPDLRSPPTGEEGNIGWHLALGHGFRSPMSPAADAPSSAWSSPVYPAIIAAAYRMFGIGSRGATMALLTINVACFAVCVAALYFLGAHLFGSRVAGVGAGMLAAIHPLFLYYVMDLWDGMLSLALFFALTAGAVLVGRPRGKPVSIRVGAVLGVGMALLILTNASYALTLPVLYLIAFGTAVLRRPTRAALLTVLVLVLCLIPWSIRNTLAFHQFVAVRTGAGIQLWLGNAPISDGWLDERAYRFHPFVNPTERVRLLQIGEPAYNTLALARFQEGFAAAPGAYFVNCFRRAFYLMVGNPAHPLPLPLLPRLTVGGIDLATCVVNGIVLILGLAGAPYVRHNASGRDIAILLLCCAAPFLLTAVIDRYALPVRMLLVLWAGGFLGVLAARTPILRRRDDQSTAAT